MGIFCKLFERDGDQALVMKSDDDGGPAICVCFEMPGVGMFTHDMTYESEEARDKVFERCDDKMAWALVDDNRKQFKIEEGEADART